MSQLEELEAIRTRFVLVIAGAARAVIAAREAGCCARTCRDQEEQLRIAVEVSLQEQDTLIAGLRSARNAGAWLQ